MTVYKGETSQENMSVQQLIFSTWEDLFNFDLWPDQEEYQLIT